MAGAKRPRPRWRSLKLGDVLMEAGQGSGGPSVLVKEDKRKQVFGEGQTYAYAVYWRYGTFLDLMTGQLWGVELDDVGVRSEILRAKQEKKGDPQRPEGPSRREEP